MASRDGLVTIERRPSRRLHHDRKITALANTGAVSRAVRDRLDHAAYWTRHEAGDADQLTFLARRGRPVRPSDSAGLESEPRRAPSCGWRGALADQVRRILHWLLYMLLLIIPILGWMNASFRGFPVSLFGLFEMPKAACDTTSRLSMDRRRARADGELRPARSRWPACACRPISPLY